MQVNYKQTMEYTKYFLGQDVLDSYESDIAIFKEAYLALGINITSKAHIVFEHIADFFKRMNNGKGLGYYSEQARYITESYCSLKVILKIVNHILAQTSRLGLAFKKPMVSFTFSLQKLLFSVYIITFIL